MYVPFYDPNKTYEENFTNGPFGVIADSKTYKNKGNPSYDIFGNKIYLPFGIGAGPLINGTFVKAALDKGFDVVVYKTVRTQKHACNPFPNIVPLPIRGNLTREQMKKGVVPTNKYINPLTIINSFGVPSYPPTFWQRDLAKVVSYVKKGTLVIGSFQGTIKPHTNKESFIQDFVKAAAMVKETGCQVLEVNLSCPNEGTSHLLCFDRETSTKIVNAIKNEIGNTPLIIKIVYFEDKNELKKLLQTIGKLVQGIAVTNTISTKIIHKDGSQFLSGGPGRLWSGAGGRGIMWAGLEMVKLVREIRQQFGFTYKIFGYGGVSTPDDYQIYKKAGADVVMSATGAIWNPYLAQEIKEKFL